MSMHRIRGALLTLGVWAAASAAASGQFQWHVVVNNGDVVPGDVLGRTFNSYNQPSLNVDRLVVFRARSKGGMGNQPAHGIYTRDMASGGPITVVFDRNTNVPEPNNLGSAFTEPPAFPRIDMWTTTSASRGVHQPVWNYQVDPVTESRAGTTGIYVDLAGSLITGASNVGMPIDYQTGFPYGDVFLVPGSGGLRFDVFPGAPAVTDGATIAFKGNYTEGTTSRTGVYYRDLTPVDAGGAAPTVLIADNRDTLIPGTGTVFGSTAPPSAAGREAVFAGFDDEDDPSLGGLYLAPLAGPTPPLTPLVRIGDRVPGERQGVVFNRLGEGVSFDGRFVGFWGAWGADTRTLRLQCPVDGNADVIAYCNETYPDGFEATVPVHQGIFVHDRVTGQTLAVAKAPDDYSDFLYWNFSGQVPDSDEEGEPARWRSAAFVAASGLVDGTLRNATFHAAFKARTGAVVDEAYVDPVDGIYLALGPGQSPRATVVETGWPGTLFDPAAVDPSTLVPLPVTAMGIERDGFRGNAMAITVTMATAEAGWAGIYATTVPWALNRPRPQPRPSPFR